MNLSESTSRLLGNVSARLRRTGYLRKWIILGALIGVVAGLGAILFTTALDWATRFFLGTLAGYTPPSPIGEANSFGSGSHLVHPWAIPLVVGLGGLLSGILVFRFAPEAEGHGTDAAIVAVHHGPRGIRARVSVLKIVASALTIGSGGSGGREGPTAQISAGFGSMLSRWLDLTPADARVAVTVGIGAGIGAIFRAPLGGAILGAEILYRDDVEVEALIPSIVASIVGFAVFGAVEGFSPIFGVLGYRFEHPVELVYFAAIGIAAGLIGRLYATSFYGLARVMKRLPGNRMLKPAVAGLVVGLMALVVPEVLGTGYGWVQAAMGPRLLTIPLWIVLVLPFAKILATSLSIGSGGSGGIFGPGMVIGGFLGAGAWRLLSDLPGVPHSPAPFVVVGMIACFGSIAHAPIAVMLMVAEMTGSLQLLAPAMVAVGLAALVVGDVTIYTSQIKNRNESPARGFRSALPLLATLSVSDAMRTPRLVLDADTPVRGGLDTLIALGLAGAPVGDDRGRFRGMIDTGHLKDVDPKRTVGQVCDKLAPTVAVEANLDAVVDILAVDHVARVAVLDRDRRIVGIVAASDLIRAYRHSLEGSLKRLGSTFRGATLLEQELLAGARMEGRSVSDAAWPAGTVVIAIQRGEERIFPELDTTLVVGDIVSILAPAGTEDQIHRLVAGETEPDESAEDETLI
ncbi:MAG: chloride channel protein [Actinomycetota bacterium]